MGSRSGLLGFSLALSVALHAAALALHFTLPAAPQPLRAAPLEVYLAGAATRARPDKPQVLARTSAEGGGNAAETRIGKPGDPLADAQRRIAELETLQRRMLTQLESPAATAAVGAAEVHAVSKTFAEPAPRELEARDRGPRTVHVGLRAAAYRYSQYVDDWRRRIERLGNLHYPEKARGRTYGSLRLSVAIKADGSLAGVALDRSSGHELLDRAAEKYVRMAAPYPPFPAEFVHDVDVLVITQTWHFEPGDRVAAD